MRILEIGFTPKLQPQFKSRRKNQYKFIDCYSAIKSLDEEGSVEYIEFINRLMYAVEAHKPDLIVSQFSFQKYEIADLTRNGKIVYIFA